jgi:hypothetical protein
MKRFVPLIVLAMLALSAAGQAQAPAPAQQAAPAFPAFLVGQWRSANVDILLSSDLDRSVFGPNASSRRTTEMRIRADGAGTITVTRKVIDRRGRTIPGTLAIEEVQFVLEAETDTGAPRPHFPGRIVKGERRHPGIPGGPSTVEGFKVEVVPFEMSDTKRVEIRFDTPEGTGSFWETLRRVAGSAT